MATGKAKTLKKTSTPNKTGSQKSTASGSGPAADQESNVKTSVTEDPKVEQTDDDIEDQDDEFQDDQDDETDDLEDDDIEGDDLDGTGNGPEATAGAEITPAPTPVVDEVDPERPWLRGAPHDAVVLGPSDPMVVKGLRVGNNAILTHDVHRAFLAPNSKTRWSYHLLHRKGSTVAMQNITTLLDQRQVQETKDEADNGAETK